MRHRLLIHSADQVVCVVTQNERILTGKSMKNIAVLSRKIDEEDGVSVVVGGNGKILYIDFDMVVKQQIIGCTFDRIIDASGMCVVPGLIDGHTHPVWAGDRVHEFSLKLAGASYMEVHEAGGGINFTVDQTTRASEDELYSSLVERLQRMLESGTTLVECKSGYGLKWETELKMLNVIEQAKKQHKIEISSTYCAAHAIPKGSDAEAATDDILNNQIKILKDRMDSGLLHVDNIDVFCETGVFNVDQTKKILIAGRDIGLNINFHGEELSCLKSAEMGANIGAVAISHLEHVSDTGIQEMMKSGTVAVILPTTAYILRLPPPPVRKMIDNNVAVALGTDFNPNAFCLSMGLVMHLACVNLHMTLEEALVASTINAAASLKKSDTHGSIEVGKVGDLLILNTPRWEHLIFQLGGHDHVIKYVVKNGEVVVERN